MGNSYAAGSISDKIGRIAAEMMDARAVQFEDGFHAFADYLKSLATLSRTAFGITDMLRVEAAWQDFERELWRGGFIVDLRSGLRVYVETFEEERPEEVRLRVIMRELEPESGFENFPGTHPVKVYGWIKRPSELNELLSRASMVAAIGWRDRN